MSPIELWWNELERKEKADNRRILHKLQEVWQQIDSNSPEKLISRKPSIRKAIIRDKGEQIDENNYKLNDVSKKLCSDVLPVCY